MNRMIIALRLWRDTGLSYPWRRAWRAAKHRPGDDINIPWYGIACRLLTLIAIGLAFKFGVDVGAFMSEENLAAVCRDQTGAKLIATHQQRDGVLCSFGNAYGLNLTHRKATKK